MSFMRGRGFGKIDGTRRQKTGEGRPEKGDRRQETGDRKGGTGKGRQVKGDRYEVLRIV